MGLDMYLNVRKYVDAQLGTWQDENRPPNPDFHTLVETAKIALDSLPESRRGYAMVEIPALYWRKSNAIHNWFVTNCARGEDDCKPVYVSRNDLTELLNVCRSVLTKTENPEEVLPTGSGFFFGSTDYDEWYFEDIKRTATEFDALLSDPSLEDCEFVYRASW